MRMRHIFVCGLSGSAVFIHIISKTGRFSKKKITEHKMCVLIVSATFVWNISRFKKTWARYDFLKKKNIGFYCFTVDFNSLNLTYQLMYFYIQ